MLKLWSSNLIQNSDCLGRCFLLVLIFRAIAGLSDIQGLEIASDIQSPIVFLRLKKSTGSSKSDLQLLEDVAARVSLIVLAILLIQISMPFPGA